MDNSLFNKKITISELPSKYDILKIENEHKYEFSETQKHIFLNYNGLKINIQSTEGANIVNSLNKPVAEFDEFIPLEYFNAVYEDFKDFELDMELSLLKDFSPLASTFANIWALIGVSDHNMDEIWLWSMEFYNWDDERNDLFFQKIASNYVEFVNNIIISKDEGS